jgi:hypothetical protein
LKHSQNFVHSYPFLQPQKPTWERNFKKKIEDEIESNGGSDGDAEDRPPPEPFNDPHPDNEKKKRGKNETDEVNDQRIKNQYGNTQQGPEPGALRPEGWRGRILLPALED